MLWRVAGVDSQTQMIGHAVKQARLRRKESLEAGAAAAGISVNTLRKIEAGQLVRASNLQPVLDHYEVRLPEPAELDFHTLAALTYVEKWFLSASELDRPVMLDELLRWLTTRR